MGAEEEADTFDHVGRRRVALRAVVIGLFFFLTALPLLSVARPEPDKAPPAANSIQFNHKAHIEKGGMSCTKCHGGTEKRARAGFPPDIYCSACHTSPRTDSPEEAKLIELLAKGKPLVWSQATRLAPYVYFSHRRHVVSGNIDCTKCHGDIGKRTTPVKTPAITFSRRPGMFRCIHCHQESGSLYAQIDCVNCHR